MPSSIRLRITPTELSTLVGGSEVFQRLGPDDSWSIGISPGAKAGLTLRQTEVRIVLAREDIEKLADTSCEGVYLISEHDPPINYFIEKDFPCAHPRPVAAKEAETETFLPPPDFKRRHQTNLP